MACFLSADGCGRPWQQQPGPFRARSLQRAFHPFAAWPRLLHCALHLGFRLSRFIRLVADLVILFSRNPGPVLVSAPCALLGHHRSPPIVRLYARTRASSSRKNEGVHERFDSYRAGAGRSDSKRSTCERKALNSSRLRQHGRGSLRRNRMCADRFQGRLA